jgi:hypothetical protein
MEFLIYFGVLALGYCAWIKLKAFFTGRTFLEQLNNEDARSKERVCRNCKHCLLGTTCEYTNYTINANKDVCNGFERK